MEIRETRNTTEPREQQTVETPVKEAYQKPTLTKHEALLDITAGAGSPA